MAAAFARSASTDAGAHSRLSRSTTSVGMVWAPLDPYCFRYAGAWLFWSGATSTWPDCRAVRNWLLVSGTRRTSSYARPASLSARSSMTPCACPCDEASLRPLKSPVVRMSLPGLVAKR